MGRGERPALVARPVRFAQAGGVALRSVGVREVEGEPRR